MADLEKKLMRMKKDDLKGEARKRSLAENGTKTDLVLVLKSPQEIHLTFVILLVSFCRFCSPYCALFF